MQQRLYFFCFKQIQFIYIYNNQIMFGAVEIEQKQLLFQHKPYVIRFRQGSQSYGQQGWFFCVDQTLNCLNKKRSEDTRYPFIHKINSDLLQYNNRWRFEPQHDGVNIYKIRVGRGQFEGHQLCCFQDQQNDFRDMNSFFTFVAPYNKFDKYNKWQVEKIGDNIYIIQNFDNKCYLSAHRFYQQDYPQYHFQKDARNIDSTWIMAHNAKETLAYWEILPF